MLQQIDCYRHANKANQRASECRDPLERREFLYMAERWLKQAHRYECAKRGLKGFRRSANPRILGRRFAAIKRI